MPLVDKRPVVLASAVTGKYKTAGKIRVKYLDVRRKTYDALVLGAGTTTGLKLLIPSRMQNKIVDNVPLSGGSQSSNVYSARQ